MFIIASEDYPKVQATVSNIIYSLSEGASRVDKPVYLGDNYTPITVTGYWVIDTMRIDIKVKK